MSFFSERIDDMGRLKPGEAFFSTEGYYTPCKIVTPNIKDALQIELSPSDSELRKTLHHSSWYAEHINQVFRNDLVIMNEKMDRFERLIIRCAQRMLQLHRCKNQPRKQEDSIDRSGLGRRVAEEAKNILDEVEEGFQELAVEPFSSIANFLTPERNPTEEVRLLYQGVIRRYQERISPSIDQWRERIGRFIRQCEENDHGGGESCART